MAILGLEIAFLELLLCLSMFLVSIFEIGPFRLVASESTKINFFIPSLKDGIQGSKTANSRPA
jgi:hypothetical protein